MRYRKDGHTEDALSQARMQADPFHDYDDQVALARIAAHVTALSAHGRSPHPTAWQADRAA
ncbi:hypothetical protein [Streptomyces albireticuli]|uniref:Uncharacterized protein n=1 Tax=Streptomyces albireticuli TaxID=1940 RepID=A0A2A2D847_9ACTN|nr:hypothetical protein [Streptomyces albireticuli]MCD9146183.1 hypothetical protein [Streptomyces albireticuli]MCD9166175.1 hypothetical protein [Streptomyces albireticuli]MCD9196479.1 hypothetical protein [Streptomyces albireticuli]PAU47482.1 hypothetical protein CK936_18535 [Streptomyces albireticuli]